MVEGSRKYGLRFNTERQVLWLTYIDCRDKEGREKQNSEQNGKENT
jgi:hypothetical protein